MMNNTRQWLARLILINLVIVGGVTLALTETSAQLIPFPSEPEPTFLEGYALVGDTVLPVDSGARATFQANPWPQGIVYYTFASNVSETNRNYVYAAMAELESVAGVVFLPRTTQANYVEIISDRGNWSYIGMIGGRQQLGLYNWNAKYVVVHELMHALGFWHEQSRPDRDDYVVINWHNIIDGMGGNFEIRQSASTIGAYDFESVMHYFPTAFTKNGQRTIDVQPNYTQYRNTMGQQQRLTDLDKAGLLARYPSLQGDYASRGFTLSATQPVVQSSTNTTNATRLSAEPTPTCAADIGRTVWYKVTPTTERTLTITTSGFDTAVAVFTGRSGSWRQQACADQHAGGSAESVSFSARAGQTYYIMVGGRGGASGNLSLTLNGARNLLTNGGFEWTIAPWTVTHSAGRADDRAICNKRSQPLSGSRCSLMFVGGAGEASVVRQNITPASTPNWTFSAGQSYTASFSAMTSSADANLIAKVIVFYLDGSKQVFRTDPVVGFIPAHQTYSVPFSLTRSDVRRIRVVFTHYSASGRVWVDHVNLTAGGTSAMPTEVEAGGLLPMPPAP
ncbi:MAG: M12 family metallopeptidase [Anaerolineae bacterium]|nr:M12 family metallopeptidase [Anaerolineae bacterium]